MWTPLSNHKFKLGNRPSKSDHRDLDAMKAMRIAPTAAPPASATIRPFVSILDQGQLGSCTCNAVAQVLHVEEVKDLIANGSTVENALVEAEFMSRLFAYYIARTIDGTVAQDAGTEIRNVFKGISAYGYPPESAWAYSDDSRAGAPFTQMPSSDAFRRAFDQNGSAKTAGAPLVTYSRIVSGGEQRVTDVKLAIAAGHAVAFGTEVPESLTEGDFGNGAPLPPPGPATAIAGGHAMTIGEYDQDGFGIINSWGLGFGVAGWFRMSPAYIMWNQTTDLWIAQKAPIISGTVTT